MGSSLVSYFFQVSLGAGDGEQGQGRGLSFMGGERFSGFLHTQTFPVRAMTKLPAFGASVCETLKPCWWSALWRVRGWGTQEGSGVLLHYFISP